MAFNGDGTKLVGDDGYLQTAVFGAEILGDAATPLPVGSYVIIKVAAVSTFPAPADSDGAVAAVGDLIEIQGTAAITPAVNDNVVTLTLTDKCDAASWTMGYSKDEIEVTTLCDLVKKYRVGKPDMAGTMEGVFTVGLTDTKTGLLREFITIINQNGATSFDKFEQASNVYFGKFYLNEGSATVDTEFVIAPFQLYGISMGGAIGSAQSFSSSFRFANLSYTSAAAVVVTLSPTFHRIGR